MNARQRFMQTMTFGTPDRAPHHELGLWGQAIERWLGEGAPPEAVEGDWFNGLDYWQMDRREFLDVNLGMLPPFEPEVLEETDRYVVARNAQGIVTKALKEGTVRGTRPSMDQYLRFAVATPEDFADLRRRYDPTDPARYPDRWDERVQQWREREHPLCLGVNACMGLYSNMRIWMGTENLSLAFHDQPSLIHDMLDFIVEFAMQAFERALAEVEIDYFNYFEDFAYKTGPLFSPAVFRQFFLHRYRRLNEYLRSQGVRLITLDSDGNTELLLPLLIESGINGHWPLEIAAGMEPLKLRREYGCDLALSGGIDKRELTKDRAAIDRELQRKVPELLQEGGYIPTIDHTAPPDISYDNFCYYMERKMELLEGGPVGRGFHPAPPRAGRGNPALQL